jgi:outer membrane protein TolC
VNVPLRLARRRAAVEEARARLERVESERTGLADEVRLAVASAAERVEESRHLLHLYEDRLLPAARDQVEAARAGFETGRNDFLALIEAERSLRSARLGYEEARASLSRRDAELRGAIGALPEAR